MIEKIILTLVPIIATSIMGYLTGQATRRANRKDEMEEKASKQMKNIRDGVCSLLRVKIIEYHDRYMKAGEIPHYARENFDDMYQAYHALGGNGTGTIMYNEICKLKSKSE